MFCLSSGPSLESSTCGTLGGRGGGEREVILARQAFSEIHAGKDNLNVLRGVAEMIDKGIDGVPLPPIKDGDLLQWISIIIVQRREHAVAVSEVKDVRMKMWLVW